MKNGSSLYEQDKPTEGIKQRRVSKREEVLWEEPVNQQRNDTPMKQNNAFPYELTTDIMKLTYVQIQERRRTPTRKVMDKNKGQYKV